MGSVFDAIMEGGFRGGIEDSQTQLRPEKSRQPVRYDSCVTETHPLSKTAQQARGFVVFRYE
ncbi:hypothetical protein [Mycobacterium vicinigordonae]|uniref:Uncharacterized protein n=1 Tax=Mycobacterium vicinigordonae TaxID=1719132 RepID=A0A7D6HZ30_9MYCO|nr:hypothetical protein [Mycobacterium vicinigordonae]QLL06154.1 hypothetical protein H0P51_20615 [Mycobacterium vicinigordonae]